MVEPAFRHYFEGLAPDARWILALLFFVIVLLRDRVQRRPGAPPEEAEHQGVLARPHVLLLVAVVACFYLWTFIAGNGRYFLAGLLLVGPCVFLAARRLPGSPMFRYTLLVGGVGAHLAMLAAAYDNDTWRWARWVDGPALAVAPSEHLQQAATYFNLSSNTHAAFVPHVHPQSSWISVRDFTDRVPPDIDKRMTELLTHPTQPSFVLLALSRDTADGAGQPNRVTRAATDVGLARFRLHLTEASCVTLAFPAQGSLPMQFGAAEGFWACPIHYDAKPADAVLAIPLPDPVRNAYARMEAACPAHFPANGARDVPRPADWLRSYPGTEMRLFVEQDTLYYAYYVTLTGTPVGTLAQLREAPPKIDCQRLVGRYRPPWLRD